MHLCKCVKLWQNSNPYAFKLIYLSYNSAPFAAAQVYHSLNRFEEAYEQYKKSADDRRLAHNRIGRTSKLMVARYILSYVPLESDSSTAVSYNPDNLSKDRAFNILYSLATDDHFEPSFYWLGKKTSVPYHFQN